MQLHHFLQQSLLSTVAAVLLLCSLLRSDCSEALVLPSPDVPLRTDGQSHNVNRQGILDAYRKGQNDSSIDHGNLGPGEFGGLKDQGNPTSPPNRPTVRYIHPTEYVLPSNASTADANITDAIQNETSSQEAQSTNEETRRTFQAERFLAGQRCRVKTRSIILQVEGCSPKQVNVTTCRGRCASWVTPNRQTFSLEDDEDSHLAVREYFKQGGCNCCLPVVSSSESTTAQRVTLTCENKERTVSLPIITACACQQCTSRL